MAARTVLHLIDTGGPGGAETVFLHLVRGLDPDRWRSIVTVPEHDWLASEMRALGIEPVLLATDGSFDLAYLRHIIGLIRRYDVDLVQAHLLASGAYASLAGLATGVPTVCTLHGQSDLLAGQGHVGIKVRLLDRRANRIVFVSESLRRLALGSHRLRPRGTAVIPNGIDVDRFRPRGATSLRDELGVSDRDVLIGAVGNVRPPKAYDDFLRMAARLLADPERAPGYGTYRFAIVGDTRGPVYARLLRERERLGLTRSVTFTGFRSDVTDIIRSFDIYVLCSHAEGFSLSTVQAMACGVPVVATRCGGPEEIIDHDTTGVLVRPGAPRLLAEAVDDLLRDPARRARLTRAASAAVRRRFTVDAMVRAYESLYAGCLDLPSHAAGGGVTEAAGRGGRIGARWHGPSMEGRQS